MRFFSESENGPIGGLIRPRPLTGPVHILNYSKLLHYVMYFNVTFAAFTQELISTTRWQFLTMLSHLLYRTLHIAIFRFCGQVV